MAPKEGAIMDRMVDWALELDQPGWIKWPLVMVALVLWCFVFLAIIGIYCVLQYLFWSAVF